MIIIIAGVVVALLLLGFLAKIFGGSSDDDDIMTLCLMAVFIIVCTAAVVAVAIGITGSIFYDRSDQIKNTTRTEVALINDNVGTIGSWSLFGGSVESTGKFFYYSDDHGVHRLQSTSADETEIVEDSADPYVEEIQYRDQWRAWGIEQAKDTKYVFHIPEGSINHTIDLDGE